MTGTDLQALGFSGWGTLNRVNKFVVLDNLPQLPAVYALKGPFYPATEGHSDLYYIGSATNTDGVRLRIRQYYHPGPTQWTSRRIHDLTMASNQYRLAFAIAPDVSAAKRWETALLNEFRSGHGTLPSENRRAGAMQRDMVKRVLDEMRAFEQPEWSSEHRSGTCAVCGAFGRMEVTDVVDPFYRGRLLGLCTCGAAICDDEACSDEHAGCP